MAEESVAGAPVVVPTVDIDKFCYATSFGTNANARSILTLAPPLWKRDGVRASEPSVAVIPLFLSCKGRGKRLIVKGINLFVLERALSEERQNLQKILPKLQS